MDLQEARESWYRRREREGREEVKRVLGIYIRERENENFILFYLFRNAIFFFFLFSN